MISVLDYGMGNIGSVLNMIKKVGGQAKVISSYNEVVSADKILLPGVGAFDAGILALNKNNLGQAILEASMKGTPILGICLGMQLLLDSSEEGTLPGLGIVKGKVKRFNQAEYSIKVPHMGWNELEIVKDNKLLDYSGDKPRFYFVHSYYVTCKDQEDVTSYAFHGKKFVASFQRGHIHGVQFHPEKSHSFGMSLFKRFIEL